MNRFNDLHKMDTCLVIGNAWDPMSALIMEQQGFKAIGTTSWGIANSVGYKDGENISFPDYFEIIKKILSVVSIPVSVDIESGFSPDHDIIISNVLQLASVGCVGINIEDSTADYALKDMNDFSLLLKELRKSLDANGYPHFFINARIDTYIILGASLDETINRAIQYEESGANGIFIPLMTEYSDIKSILEAITIPLNIMSLPNATDISHFNNLGVKRYSFGNAMSDHIIAVIEELSQSIVTNNSTSILYEHNELKTQFN